MGAWICRSKSGRVISSVVTVVDPQALFGRDLAALRVSFGDPGRTGHGVVVHDQHVGARLRLGVESAQGRSSRASPAARIRPDIMDECSRPYFSSTLPIE